MSDLVERLRLAQTNHDELRFGWLAEAADEIGRLNAVIAEQEAHIQSLQNRWATRPLDHADGEALIAENRRLQAQLKARLAKAITLLKWPNGPHIQRHAASGPDRHIGYCQVCTFLAQWDKSLTPIAAALKAMHDAREDET